MKILSRAEIDCFKSFLASHDFFYIVGHKEPDGDCISSCLALSYLLEAKGKKFQLLSAGPFKKTEVNPHKDLFSNEMQFLTEDERKKSALIMADCSEYSRLGEIEGDMKSLDLCIIDHHKTANAPANALSFIDATSPATCAIVQQLYEGVAELSENAAKILFTGLCTDTGFFRFLTDDASEVFVQASRLVSKGANPRKTYDFITGGKSYESRKLLSRILLNAERYLQNRLVVCFETLEDTAAYGNGGRDSDALYSLLLAVEGVEAVAFVRQESQNSCTLGLRSRDAVDVSLVASKFSGGGHKNASGASVDGKLETLIPIIVKEFARIM